MQKDENRFLQMPEVYDKIAPYLVPCYDFLQESIFDIINFEKDRHFNFIDLGAGSGIQIERILKHFPNSKAICIDSSLPFIEKAKQRLNKYFERVQYINSRLESDWCSMIGTTPDLVVSMSAIHHLDSAEKENLYNNVCKILSPDGWFFNIDEMRSKEDSVYLDSMNFWSEYVRNALNFIPLNLKDYYNEWNNFFNKWKIRNIDNFNSPKQKGDDIHETFEIQLEYLKNAGFKKSSLFVKYHLWCIIGGQK